MTDAQIGYAAELNTRVLLHYAHAMREWKTVRDIVAKRGDPIACDDPWDPRYIEKTYSTKQVDETICDLRAAILEAARYASYLEVLAEGETMNKEDVGILQDTANLLQSDELEFADLECILGVESFSPQTSRQLARAMNEISEALADDGETSVATWRAVIAATRILVLHAECIDEYLPIGEPAEHVKDMGEMLAMLAEAIQF